MTDQAATPLGRVEAATIQALLDLLPMRRGSDLHLSVGIPPAMRIHGDLAGLPDWQVATQAGIDSVINALLDDDQQTLFRTRRNVDLGISSDHGERYRINVYRERGMPALAIRWLANDIQSFEALKLPASLERLYQLKHGLVLVTGATGSGKTTTIASILHRINQTRPCHILTIEDPVEFIHANQLATVHQREVGRDVDNFADATRAALREDPDVVLIGEMRDVETMHTALMLAETGHLVFATLHTNDAVGVIDRLVGAFPGPAQSNVRAQLSVVLRAVVTQMLLRTRDGDGRVPVNEILWVNAAVAHLIREHKPEQIRTVMETGRELGNQTLEQALAERVSSGLVDLDLALAHTSRPQQLRELVDRTSAPHRPLRDSGRRRL